MNSNVKCQNVISLLLQQYAIKTFTILWRVLSLGFTRVAVLRAVFLWLGVSWTSYSKNTHVIYPSKLHFVRLVQFGKVTRQDECINFNFKFFTLLTHFIGFGHLPILIFFTFLLTVFNGYWVKNKIIHFHVRIVSL